MTPSGPAAPAAILVDAEGIRPAGSPQEAGGRVAAGGFVWLDLVGGGADWQAPFLAELGFDDADRAWALRFEQSGRMAVGRERMRVATWISVVFGSMTEIHLLASRRCVVTLWRGDPAALAEIRQRFAERAGGLASRPAEAAAILLQLLLATLHAAVSEVDTRIQTLRTRIRQQPGAIDLPGLTERLQQLQGAWSDIDHYSSAVRGAIIGVEALPGIDAAAAAELHAYAEQVEDLERRFQERARWGADLLQDYATQLAQRQGEQISRLTIVSLIFLPITFLTGFFGMNFGWLVNAIGGPVSFVVLGLVIPALCVVATILWFRRRGVM
ncbi:MAG: CorA family divalent cation transporter [Dongiaceae bacterium]